MPVELPENLRRKLEELREQHDDLGRRLEDPAVLADHREVARLASKRKALSSVVEGLVAFDAAAGERTEYQAAIEAGDDPELVALAREFYLGNANSSQYDCSPDNINRQVDGDLMDHNIGTFEEYACLPLAHIRGVC